jgi:hypothetical protein
MILEGAAPGGDCHGDLLGVCYEVVKGVCCSIWEGGWAAEKRVVMYGRTYTRRRRARDVQHAEECAARTAGAREEEGTTRG